MFVGAFFSLSALAFASEFLGETDSSEHRNPYNSYNLLIYDKIIDGDTFHASGKIIRLWGIDAPEKHEELYEVSSKALELFLEEAVLKCKQIDIDRYERDVMHCYSGDADLGGLMVKLGFARDYPKYSGGFYSGEQKFAEDGKLGLWK